MARKYAKLQKNAEKFAYVKKLLYLCSEIRIMTKNQYIQPKVETMVLELKGSIMDGLLGSGTGIEPGKSAPPRIMPMGPGETISPKHVI